MNNPVVDMTKTRSKRSMIGFDIENWRAQLGLTKFQAQSALGFRNSNQYNEVCLVYDNSMNPPLLPISLEILIRLYDEDPSAPGWESFNYLQLFKIMYDKDLDKFKDPTHYRHARVDLGFRFTKLFGRSGARQYDWLKDSSLNDKAESKANAFIECILCKLTQFENPGEVFNRVAIKTWLLRGVSIDSLHRIPTPENPPSRKKTGRKPGVKRVVVRKAPTAKDVDLVVAKVRKSKAPLLEKIKVKKSKLKNQT